MKTKEPEADCIACHGTGSHAPILVGPVDPIERKKNFANMPDAVPCGCTRIWENPHPIIT